MIYIVQCWNHSFYFRTCGNSFHTRKYSNLYQTRHAIFSKKSPRLRVSKHFDPIPRRRLNTLIIDQLLISLWWSGALFYYWSITDIKQTFSCLAIFLKCPIKQQIIQFYNQSYGISTRVCFEIRWDTLHKNCARMTIKILYFNSWSIPDVDCLIYELNWVARHNKILRICIVAINQSKRACMQEQKILKLLKTTPTHPGGFFIPAWIWLIAHLNIYLNN